MGGFSSKYF